MMPSGLRRLFIGFSLVWGLVSGLLSVVGAALASGMRMPLGDYEEATRALLQEHSLVLAAPGLLSLTCGRLVARLGGPGRPALGCILLGVLALVTAALPPLQGTLATPVFEARMRMALGDNYSELAAEAPVRLQARRFDLVAWLNIPTAIGGAPEVEERVYRSVGAQDLALDLYMPNGSGPHPILVLIHGGGLEGGSRRDVRLWAKSYVRQGYLVAAVDYRLAPGASLPAPLEDVQCAIAWLRRNFAEDDAGRGWVGLIGYSSGGHLALLAGFHGEVALPPDCPAEPHDVQAVVAVAPVTDLGFYRPSILGFSQSEDAQSWAYASPMSQAIEGAPLPPLMIVHGHRDSVVNHEDSARFVSTLRTGTPVVYLDPPWSGHVFSALPGGLSSQLVGYSVDRFLGWTQVQLARRP